MTEIREKYVIYHLMTLAALVISSAGMFANYMVLVYVSEPPISYTFLLFWLALYLVVDYFIIRKGNKKHQFL